MESAKLMARAKGKLEGKSDGMAKGKARAPGKGRNDWTALRFLAVWLALFFGIYLLLAQFPGFGFFEGISAHSSAALLNSFGAKASVLLEEGNVFLLVEGKRIWISELCSGLFELALVVSAIIATLEAKWRKRIIGALGAIVFGLAFNAFRIFASTMQILSTSIEKAELTHDFLFRISIIVVIVLYYYLWVLWAKK